MPYCPSCKYEYNAQVSVCPDCDQTLVSHLPTPAVSATFKSMTGSSGAFMPDDSWVGVCRIVGQMDQGLAKGALDTNNIPSMLISSAFTTLGGGSGLSMQAGLSGKAGGDVILVPREFREDAEIILEAILGDDFNKMDAAQ